MAATVFGAFRHAATMPMLSSTLTGSMNLDAAASAVPSPVQHEQLKARKRSCTTANAVRGAPLATRHVSIIHVCLVVCGLTQFLGSNR